MADRESERVGPEIPFLDLKRQHAEISDEVMRAVERVVADQSFVLGAAVREFEEAIAAYVGAKHAIGVASGTDALYLSFRAVGLEPGDEVITSAFTFFGTAGAIRNAGGRPVFADIDPHTFDLDPGSVAAAVSDRTRAIVPVHLFGQMAAMGPILELAEDRGLHVIEDAAQSIGAKLHRGGRWASAGSLGTLGCFSFYPTKNLGGWGDGGLITTEDDTLADRLRRLREHGEDRTAGRYVHSEVGINSRLDALQAAVLGVKLRRLPGWTENRRVNAADYDRRLANVPEIAVPAAAADRFHVYNLYTVRAERRDALREHLAGRGIGTAVYYPVPLHMQPCFSSLGYGPGDCPEAERAAREVVSLPIYPELTGSERTRVIEAIAAFYGR